MARINTLDNPDFIIRDIRKQLEEDLKDSENFGDSLRTALVKEALANVSKVEEGFKLISEREQQEENKSDSTNALDIKKSQVPNCGSEKANQTAHSTNNELEDLGDEDI